MWNSSPISLGSAKSVYGFLTRVASNTTVEAFKWISPLTKVILQNVEASDFKAGEEGTRVKYLIFLVNQRGPIRKNRKTSYMKAGSLQSFQSSSLAHINRTNLIIWLKMRTLCPPALSFGNNLSMSTSFPDAWIMALRLSSSAAFSLCCSWYSETIPSSAPVIKYLSLTKLDYTWVLWRWHGWDS